MAKFLLLKRQRLLLQVEDEITPTAVTTPSFSQSRMNNSSTTSSTDLLPSLSLSLSSWPPPTNNKLRRISFDNNIRDNDFEFVNKRPAAFRKRNTTTNTNNKRSIHKTNSSRSRKKKNRTERTITNTDNNNVSTVIGKDSRNVLVVVTDYDVLGGKDRSAQGNKRFRDLIVLHHPTYILAQQTVQKNSIAKVIVDAIKNGSPPGRFLRKDTTTGKWYNIGDKKAIEKTSKALWEIKLKKECGNSDDQGIINNDNNNLYNNENSLSKMSVDSYSHPEPNNNAHSLLLISPPKNTTNSATQTTVAKRLLKERINNTNNNNNVSTVDKGRNNVSVVVTDYDVLGGQNVPKSAQGNKRFRDLVAFYQPSYIRAATKIQKISIAKVIVESIRNGNPPGRFLRKNTTTGKWYDIGDKKSIEKTSRALQENKTSVSSLMSTTATVTVTATVTATSSKLKGGDSDDGKTDSMTQLPSSFVSPSSILVQRGRGRPRKHSTNKPTTKKECGNSDDQGIIDNDYHNNLYNNKQLLSKMSVDSYSHPEPNNNVHSLLITQPKTTTNSAKPQTKASKRLLKELASFNGNGYDQIYAYDKLQEGRNGAGVVVCENGENDENNNNNTNKGGRLVRRSKRRGKQTTHNHAVLRISPHDKFMCCVNLDDEYDHTERGVSGNGTQQQQQQQKQGGRELMELSFADIYNSGRNYLLHEHVDNKDGSRWTHQALLFQYGFQCYGCQETYFCSEMKAIAQRPKEKQVPKPTTTRTNGTPTTTASSSSSGCGSNSSIVIKRKGCSQWGRGHFNDDTVDSGRAGEIEKDSMKKPRSSSNDAVCCYPNSNGVVVGARIESSLHPLQADYTITTTRTTEEDHFPMKLYQMLEDVESAGGNNKSIVSWSSDGLFFVVRQPEVFAISWMKNCVNGPKYTSFQQQMSCYKFHQKKGCNHVYSHPLFRRGHMETLHEIGRVKQHVSFMNHSLQERNKTVPAVLEGLFSPILPSTGDGGRYRTEYNDNSCDNKE